MFLKFSWTLPAIWTFGFLLAPSWVFSLVWSAFSVFDLCLPHKPFEFGINKSLDYFNSASHCLCSESNPLCSLLPCLTTVTVVTAWIRVANIAKMPKSSNAWCPHVQYVVEYEWYRRWIVYPIKLCVNKTSSFCTILPYITLSHKPRQHVTCKIWSLH